MTPGSAPYADGQHVRQPIDRPPQARPVEPCPAPFATLAAAAGLGMDAIDAIRELERRADRPNEPCPGAGMAVMETLVVRYPSSAGRLVTQCPVCEVVVEPRRGRTPDHDREVPRV